MWNDIVLKLIAAQQELAESLLRYPADSMEKYHRIVGRAEGLAQALEIVQQAMKDEEERY